MKSGAIFDMDGLLFDTEQVYNKEWYETAKRHELTIHPAMLDSLRGTSGIQMYTKIQTFWPNVKAKELVEEVFANAQASLQEAVPMKPGVIEILTYLAQQNIKLAVASSAPRELVTQNLHTAKIADYFSVVVSGDDVAISKPAPDCFLLAAEKLQLAPQDCYVFEDGIHGVRAGLAAGCAVIMVPDFIAPTPDLYERCMGIYPNLSAAREALEKQGQEMGSGETSR